MELLLSYSNSVWRDGVEKPAGLTEAPVLLKAQLLRYFALYTAVLYKDNLADLIATMRYEGPWKGTKPLYDEVHRAISYWPRGHDYVVGIQESAKYLGTGPRLRDIAAGLEYGTSSGMANLVNKLKLDVADDEIRDELPPRPVLRHVRDSIQGHLGAVYKMFLRDYREEVDMLVVAYNMGFEVAHG